jgi:hypothetical protein
MIYFGKVTTYKSSYKISLKASMRTVLRDRPKIKHYFLILKIGRTMYYMGINPGVKRIEKNKIYSLNGEVFHMKKD